MGGRNTLVSLSILPSPLPLSYHPTNAPELMYRLTNSSERSTDSGFLGDRTSSTNVKILSLLRLSSSISVSSLSCLPELRTERTRRRNLSLCTRFSVYFPTCSKSVLSLPPSLSSGLLLMGNV